MRKNSRELRLINDITLVLDPPPQDLVQGVQSDHSVQMGHALIKRMSQLIFAP